MGVLAKIMLFFSQFLDFNLDCSLSCKIVNS